MERAAAEKIFTSVGWLSQQPENFQAKLLGRGHLVALAADAYVFHADDPPGGIYGIADGSIGILVPTRGASMRLATILRAGTWFGQGPLITGRARTLAFRAFEPTVVMRVDLPALGEISAHNPQARLCFAALANDATVITIQVVHDLLIRQTERRLAATLLRIAGAHDEPASSRLRKICLSQAELAEMANTSRHSANRALREFEESGWIAISYKHIQICDPVSLEEFAYGGAD